MKYGEQDREIKCDFPGKESDEKVVALVRRHWIVISGDLLVHFIGLIIPAGGLIVLYYFYPSIFETFFYPIVVLLLSLYYLFVCCSLFKKWVDYYYDVWIITDRRLIDVEQKGFFTHLVSELTLDKIQDVSIEIKGMIPSMFNFGNINVQTAAEVEKFSLEKIPAPNQVEALLLQTLRKYSSVRK